MKNGKCYYIENDIEEPECCLCDCPRMGKSCSASINICQKCEDEIEADERKHGKAVAETNKSLDDYLQSQGKW
jgi:hypothetical protein